MLGHVRKANPKPEDKHTIPYMLCLLPFSCLPQLPLITSLNIPSWPFCHPDFRWVLKILTDFPKALKGDVKIPTYKPHTNHKKQSVSSHTLAPTTICDLSHSVCGGPLTDLGHISSVTYICHPLWFVCSHRKGFLTSSIMPSPKTVHSSQGRIQDFGK